jgi:C-terminal processing protease CtpA/Prc
MDGSPGGDHASGRVATRSRGPNVIRLAKFLEYVEKAARLPKKARLRIVEQALLLFEMNYVHLPLKRAMHAVDPIQQLKLLHFRISEMKPRDLPSATQFHRRMLEIFASTRDLHTMYFLPDPYRDQVAYLPFLVEQYFSKDANGKRVEKFLISRVARELYRTPADGKAAPFEAGVEILSWNGIPIRRAIEINGESQAGSNPDARFARGLDNLTTRPLDASLPPDELWVDIVYRTRSGRIGNQRQDWLVLLSGETGRRFKKRSRSKLKRESIDLKKTRINEIKQTMYSKDDPTVRRSIANEVKAETRTVDDRQYGYIRLFSFEVANPDRFVSEFARLITSDDFPKDGMIIDVRGNGGGRIRAGERLLQLLTPRAIEPELFQFINTSVNLDICRQAPSHWNLRRWVDSMAEAIATGATYSAGFPLNSRQSCNDIGQVYYGPVVLITDALSYSTTDIFAAGFQDNEVGEILGTSSNTGAGGANVWRYEDLMKAFGRVPKSPFLSLPKGADMVVAMRRSIRIGAFAGRPLEELGIEPDHRHYTTKRDIVGSNEDLIAHAAAILKRKPVYSLEVATSRKRGSRLAVISASTRLPSRDRSANIERVDVYLADQPVRSLQASRGSLTSERVSLGSGGREKAELRVEAYDTRRRLVAVSRKLV